jgi:hypothetical protein
VFFITVSGIAAWAALTVTKFMYSSAILRFGTFGSGCRERKSAGLSLYLSYRSPESHIVGALGTIFQFWRGVETEGCYRLALMACDLLLK